MAISLCCKVLANLSDSFTTNMTNIFVGDPTHNTYIQLVSFYLAARISTAIFYGIAAYLLPMIKGVMISQIISIIIPTALWIASIHVDMPGRLGFIVPALFLDMYGHVAFFTIFRYNQKHAPEGKWKSRFDRMFEFYPAISIEHRVERMNAFVSLVSDIPWSLSSSKTKVVTISMRFWERPS